MAVSYVYGLMNSRNLRKIRICTITYALALIGLLLAPFDFRFPFQSHVRWLAQKNGIEIVSVGGILSPSPANKLYDSLVKGNGITIEVWAATSNFEQDGPARIVSYSFDKWKRNFTLGQDHKTLIMRLRSETTDLNGKNPDMQVKDIFVSSEVQQIAVTYDYSHERVYINGERRKEFLGPGGRFLNWDPSYRLVLGNEATGNRPWVGRLFLVAIYDRALLHQELQQNYNAGVDSARPRGRVTDGLVALYTFDERKGDWIIDRSQRPSLLNLKIVGGPALTNQTFLSIPNNEDTDSAWKRMIEVAGNVLVFVPAGFLLYIAFRSRHGPFLPMAIIACAAGMSVSLIVEVLQYFSVTRTSSLADVFKNTLGTGIGVAICELHQRPRNWARR